MKRRQLLQSPLQLSLFDFEPAPVPASPLLPLAPPTPEPSGKPVHKPRILPGEHAIEYSLQRSRRRSIGFMIEDDGLRVTAPRWITIAEIEEAIRSKQSWITRKLSELQQRMARRENDVIHWRDGARIAYLGKHITLRLGATDSAAEAMLDNNSEVLTLSLSPDTSEEKLKARIQRWLQDEALRLFSQRLQLYAGKLGVTYSSLALSSASSQWGSCTVQGRIRLNWRLIHLPLDLIDYVAAHELSHLREMNHSPRFWTIVESVFPEYKHVRKMLRCHSPGAMPSS